MSPRSILKRTTERNTAAQHAVHFPPSPALCSTFSAYSPSTYDRSPIVVSKNVCALPERGGRTYVLDETACPRSSARAAHAQPSRSYHPRAMHEDRRVAVPQLIPDVSSSESDESDAFNNSPYGIPAASYYSYGSHGLPTKYEYESAYTPCVDSPTDINALAFLPYPPSPPPIDDKARRRRRQHDSALDYDRMRSANTSSSSTSSYESERVAPPPPTKKRSSSKRRDYLNNLSSAGSPNSLCSSFGSYGLSDDGCLGGF